MTPAISAKEARRHVRAVELHHQTIPTPDCALCSRATELDLWSDPARNDGEERATAKAGRLEYTPLPDNPLSKRAIQVEADAIGGTTDVIDQRLAGRIEYLEFTTDLISQRLSEQTRGLSERLEDIEHDLTARLSQREQTQAGSVDPISQPVGLFAGEPVPRPLTQFKQEVADQVLAASTLVGVLSALRSAAGRMNQQIPGEPAPRGAPTFEELADRAASLGLLLSYDPDAGSPHRLAARTDSRPAYPVTCRTPEEVARYLSELTDVDEEDQ